MDGSRKLSHFFLALTLLAGLLGLARPVQALPALMADLWVTNGYVNAMAPSGGTTLYIGGSFSYVGPPTGAFAVLDGAGAPDRAFPPIDGDIYAIASDGSGGWYVGGNFSRVGGHPCNHLAHLKADRSLDFAWNPNPNGPVRALGFGGSTLYAGGDFTSAGGQPRNYLAALDSSTGSATSWNPNPNGPLSALVVSGSILYVAGSFTEINGGYRNHIAALWTSTGEPTGWAPHANDKVYALALSHDGSTIYAGGDFTNIGGQDRNRIAALNASEALLIIPTGWDPNASSTVRTLALSNDGSTIYAGGDFTSIGGQNRNRIAALNASDALATDWDPDANNSVYALVVAPNSTVYAGGSFTSIGRQNRNYIAALNAGNSFARGWDANASNSVLTLASAPDSTVCAGGKFNSIGGKNRQNIAALDVSTGSATSWDPSANDSVYALVVAPNNTVYAGGYFTSIGWQNRNHIAALDPSSGLATAWDPNASGPVWTLLTSYDGGTIYAGGWFPSIGQQNRNYIAALDAKTALATSWNPNADGPVGVVVMPPHVAGMSDTTLYVGGYFSNIGGKSRNYIAALDLSTANATSWNPNAGGSVAALAITPAVPGMSDSTVYVGGDFTSIGGQSRNYLAALDVDTGSATDWNPAPNYIVDSLAIAPPVAGVIGAMIYAGGHFTIIGGRSRNYIAALDTSTGLATDWNPNADYTVLTLALAPDDTLYMAGGFTRIMERRMSSAGVRAIAATCQSATSGGSWRVSHWSNCGHAIPGDGDSLEVQAGHTLTLYGSLAANDLTINAGGALELPLGSSLTVEGSVTHNGRLTQTLMAPAATATNFLNLKNVAGVTGKFAGASLIPAGDMGYTRVSIYGNQKCTGASADALIQRCFDITPTTAQNARLRLYYPNAELNGQRYNALKLWHWGPGWSQVGSIGDYAYSPTCNVGQLDCYMQVQNVSAYSPFGMGSGSQPTAVRLHSFAARSVPAEGGLVLLLILGLAGWGCSSCVCRGFSPDFGSVI